MDPGGGKPGYGHDPNGNTPPAYGSLQQQPPPQGYGAHAPAGAYPHGGMSPPRHQMGPSPHQDGRASPRQPPHQDGQTSPGYRLGQPPHQDGRASPRHQLGQPPHQDGRASPGHQLGQPPHQDGRASPGHQMGLSTGQAAALLHSRGVTPGNPRASTGHQMGQPPHQEGPAFPLEQGGHSLSTGQAAALLHSSRQAAGYPRDWVNGPCGCFDNFTVCILSWFCPCYVIGQNAEYLGKDRMIYSVAAMLVPSVVHFFVRIEIRKQLNITGTELGDCCMAYWWGPCSLAQERKEVLDAMEMKEPQIIQRH